MKTNTEEIAIQRIQNAKIELEKYQEQSKKLQSGEWKDLFGDPIKPNSKEFNDKMDMINQKIDKLQDEIKKLRHLEFEF